MLTNCSDGFSNTGTKRFRATLSKIRHLFDAIIMVSNDKVYNEVALNVSGFIAQLVRASYRHREVSVSLRGHAFKPR